MFCSPRRLPIFSLTMLILTKKDLTNVLNMEAAVEAIEEAFRAYHRGETKAPLRVSLEVEDAEGQVLYMPALLNSFRDSKALGAKMVSVFNKNPAKNLPLIYASFLLNDPTTGKPLALIEGSYLTGMRTAAASALACKYLARNEAQVLGIIGAGFQAFFQIEALSTVRQINKVLIYDQIREKSEQLAERLKTKLHLDCELAHSAESLTKKSHILITATTSQKPVCAGENLQEGATVIAIGAFTPNSREVDGQTVIRSRVYMDSYKGALAEAGDILIPIKKKIFTEEEIEGELGELVTEVVSGRKNDREIILFKSVGLAIEDASTAQMAYEKALDKGIGTEVEIF